MQNKSLLAKIVGLVAVVCLALAMTFGLVACGDPTVKSVTKDGNVITVELTDGTTSAIKLDGVKDAKVENGKLVLTYADGKTADFALPNATISDPTVNNDGNTEIVVTFADGTSKTIVLGKFVADATFEDGAFTITYSDGTTAEYAIGTVVDVEVLANGQTKVTYADGTEAVIGDAACAHEFGAATDIKPASCCEDGVAVKACANCGLVALEAVAKDSDPEKVVHGKWVLKYTKEEGRTNKVEGDNGIITYSREDWGVSAYFLETAYVFGSMTTLEDYSMTFGENNEEAYLHCFEATCALCGEQFASGHKPVDQWISVAIDDPNVNICLDEHLVVKTCPTCRSVLLYDDGTFGYNKNNKLVVEKEAALGHDYGDPIVPVVVNKVGQGVNAYYNLQLVCKRCHVPQDVKATYENKVDANCQSGGYTTYKYSYTNIYNGELKTFTDTVNLDKTESTGKHVIAEGVTPFEYYDPDTNPVSYQFTEDLKPCFVNKTIKWNAGQPATCSDYKLATFTCKVCDLAIVIRLSGEHQYAENDQGTVVKPTCTYDGYTYKVCTENEEHIWRYAIQPAKGHTYEYVADTFVVTDEETGNGTATFKCACGSTVPNVNVYWVSDNPALTCQSVSSTSYTATITYSVTHIDEYGVVMNPVNKTDTVNFKIENEDEVPLHTLANVDGLIRFESYDPDTNPRSYEYSPLIGDQIKTDEYPNRPLKWNAGIPGDCDTYKLATFTCTVCGEEIVIRLSGKHERLDENDKHDVAATCTERGILEYKCLDCGRYVLQKAYDAKGHSFAPNAASWSDFLALENKDGAAVIFDCANCEEHITLYADKTTLPDATDACQTVKTDVYDFYDEDGEIYTYVVETKEGGERNLEYTYQWKDVKTEGSHTIGIYEGQTIKVAAYNEDAPEHIDSIPAYEYFLDPERAVLRWNAGIPGNCSTWKFAVFTCTECGESIVIHLSGVHKFGTDENDTKTVEPTCLNGGYTEQFCTACERWIRTATTPALGHDFGEWTIEGDLFAEAYEENGRVYINNQTRVLGVARSVCTRCEHALTANPRVLNTKLPTCGEEGELEIGYYYNNRKVASKTISVAMIDHHITVLETADHVIKFHDGENYGLGYMCVCGKFVVVETGTEAYINEKIAELIGNNNVNCIEERD